MVAFLAYYLASLLDPIALVLCAGIGFLFKSFWKGVAAGAAVYIALILLMPGIHATPIVIISKLCAGATFGLVGAALGRWLRPTSKPGTPDA
ncbi:hypothetical protein [Pseudomonas fluorescens]|uniref:Uncharacterized protein n=1 Tax=Pseudomonas fluorescens TaxID=294 RepID=A0A0D0PNL6_PSEFL|nr:hypothetical protein [Pseudomonas fluorescens]KIQ60203.1 hypothetical protein RL74_06845 [Pseudomonas fluorescens]